MSQSRILDLVNKGLSQSSFLDIYRKPVLLFSTDDDDEDETVETDIRNITDTDLLTCEGQSPTTTTKFSNSRVFFLEKTARNSSLEVTLGRDPSNDIIVSLPSVSKRHAFFREINGNWYVVDNKSTNGTNIDNTLLGPYEKALLRDNSRLVFGYGAIARFFTPIGLWGVLCLHTGLSFLQTTIFDD